MSLLKRQRVEAIVKINNLIAFSLFLQFIFASSVFSITLDEITHPLSHANRLGVGNVPENSFKITNAEKKIESKNVDVDKTSEAVKNITYADLSLKKIAKEISDDAEIESADILADIQTLWVGAAQNSETVKFIVYKLSNPDEEKPKESIVKKIILPISTVGSLAGIGIGNPVAAISSIMGSSVLGTISVDDKDLNYKFSKVNDADMIVLIRKIEELQRKIVNYYFDYISARSLLIKADEITSKRHKYFIEAQKMNDEQLLMIDSFYRSSLNKQAKLRSDFLAKRSALEQVVGTETLVQFEEGLAQREK